MATYSSNDDPFASALEQCLTANYGDAGVSFDRDGHEYALHGRKSPGRLQGPLSSIPKPSARPPITAYEGYDGGVNAFFTRDGVTWLNCKTLEEWE